MRSGVIIGLCAVACSPGADRSWLGFPESDAKTMVIASREADVILTAFDLENETRRARTDIRLGDAPPYRTVLAMLYERSLERMGYASGQLPRAANAAEGELIPEPDRGVFTTEVDEDTQEVRWRSTNGVPEDISTFRVRASADCAEFAPPTFRQEVEGRVYFAVPLDDEHVLIGAEQDLFVLSIDGRVDVSSTPLRDARAAWIAPDRSTLWFGDVFGRLWKGTPSVEQGVTDVEMLADTQMGSLFAMDGGIDGQGDVEIFIASQQARLGRLSGTTFTEVGMVPRLRNTIAWAEPGLAFVADEGVDQLYAITPNEVRSSEIGAESQIMDLTANDRFGVVAGTAEGHFYAYRGLPDQWSRVGGADFGWWSLASAPYEDGFMFLLASGFFGQYKASRGFCESSPILQILEWGKMVPLARDVVIVAIPDERPRTTIIYVPRA